MSLSLQIPNYLTFGSTQVQEMVDTEFGGPLPITHVMWYLDTHLHQKKEKVMYFQKKQRIFGEINYFPGQSVFLKAN